MTESLAYEAGSAKAVAAIQQAIGQGDTVWVEQALVALANIAPSEAVLPRALRHPAVWAQAQRDELIDAAKKHRPGVNLLSSTIGVNYGTFLSELHAFAESEHAPSISELHVAEALSKLGGDALTRAGVNRDSLVSRVAQLVGRTVAPSRDATRVWCVCDTTFFQESRALFDQVDWAHILGLPAVVLLVPPVVVRELDQQKSDPRPHRAKLQDRARKVLRVLDNVIDSQTNGQPLNLRPKLDVMIVDREPAVFPVGLDPAINDDRVVATAVAFRWLHPGLRVAVLSDDRGPRLKASRFDLERFRLPDSERRNSAESDDSSKAPS